MIYIPSNHYWIVAGSATQVYSSSRKAYVLVNDALYVAWLASGNVPGRIGSEEELWDVLIERFPAGLSVAGNTYYLQNLYTKAKALLTADDEVSKKEKGVLLVILDEFNAHANKINAIFTAINGAGTFAAMKTAIAAIADYPQRTAAQIKTSVANKIDAGQADG